MVKGKLLIIWDGLPAHRSRVVRDYEFDPTQVGPGPGKTLLIDRPEVERALLLASAPSYAAKR